MPSSNQLGFRPWGENDRALHGRRECGAKGTGKGLVKISIAERDQCIATMAKGGFPSYVELVICTEMMRDSRVHREEERATNVKLKNKKLLSEFLPAHVAEQRSGCPMFDPFEPQKHGEMP